MESEILVFEFPVSAMAPDTAEPEDVELDVEFDGSGKGLSSTSQTVPASGSVPFAKYARMCL